MNPESIQSQQKLNPVLDKSVKKIIKHKVLMYTSFSQMSTAYKIMSSQKKNRKTGLRDTLYNSLPKIISLKNDKLKRYEKQKQEKKVVDKQQNSRLEQNNQKKNTQQTNNSEVKRKRQKSMKMMKNNFLNHHYSMEFTKSNFIKSGAHLSYQKKTLSQQVQYQFNNFIKHYKDNNYICCLQIFTNFLNYTIDLNLILQFLTTLFYISQFAFLFGDYKRAIYFFDQCRQCSKYILNFQFLIQSYIGLGRCSRKVNMYQDAIRFLKKALQYAWYSNNRQKQLIIYDQIGLNYYRIGKLDRSKYFHERFAQSGFQKQDSVMKMMAKTRIRDQEKILLPKRVSQINIIFLISLSVPVKSLKILPNINLNSDFSIRNDYKNVVEFRSSSQNIQKQLYRILAQKQFGQELPEPRYQENEKYVNMIEQKKLHFAQLDFQLNRRLLKYIPKISRRQAARQRSGSYFKEKLNLDQKIYERLAQQKLKQNWYQDIVEKILRERNSNISSLRSKILNRNLHIHEKLPVEYINSVYNTYFVQILF